MDGGKSISSIDLCYSVKRSSHGETTPKSSRRRQGGNPPSFETDDFEAESTPELREQEQWVLAKAEQLRKGRNVKEKWRNERRR